MFAAAPPNIAPLKNCGESCTRIRGASAGGRRARRVRFAGRPLEVKLHRASRPGGGRGIGKKRILRFLFAFYNPAYSIVSLAMAARLILAISASLDAAAGRALSGIYSRSTRAMYAKALGDFLAWWRSKGRPSVTASVISEHKTHLETCGYSPSTINQRLAAIRRLTTVAGDAGLITPQEIIAIGRLRGATPRLVRLGKRLAAQECEALVNAPDPGTLKGKRDRCLLALLVGCALRRNEAVGLRVEDLQRKEGRWVLLPVRGRAGRLRTVPVPPWTKEALDEWVNASGLTAGPVFRALARDGSLSNRAIGGQTVFETVREYGREVGIDVKPEDLRRACANLCRREGGDLKQIQLLLGHSSIQITEQYLDSGQDLRRPPNDAVALKWRKTRKLVS